MIYIHHMIYSYLLNMILFTIKLILPAHRSSVLLFVIILDNFSHRRFWEGTRKEPICILLSIVTDNKFPNIDFLISKLFNSYSERFVQIIIQLPSTVAPWGDVLKRVLKNFGHGSMRERRGFLPNSHDFGAYDFPHPLTDGNFWWECLRIPMWFCYIPEICYVSVVKIILKGLEYIWIISQFLFLFL